MRRVLSLLLAAVVLSGCSGGADQPAAEPASSTVPVKKMTHADAQALAGKYRDEAVTAIGAALQAPATQNLVPCDGPNMFAALTYGDVPVAADQQSAVLQKLRDRYTAAKYTVEPPSTDSTDHSALNVTGPDRVTLSVVGDGTGTLRVNVATPCYSSDEPL